MRKYCFVGRTQFGAEWNTRYLLVGINVHRRFGWIVQVGLGPFIVWVMRG